MLSDSTYSTDETGETSPSIEGSGDMTSPSEASSSDLTTATSDADASTLEGSGDSEATDVSSSATETTESGATSSATVDEETETVSGTEESGATTEFASSQTDTSGSTDISSGTTESGETETTESGGTTESPETTESGVTTESPETTSAVTSDSDSTDVSGTSDITEASVTTSDTSMSSSDITTISSDGTSATETSVSDETSPSSESTSESTPFSTETSIFTETSTIETTESSDLTTENIDTTTETEETAAPGVLPPEESDAGIESGEPESEATSEAGSTDATDVTGATDETTVSGQTETSVSTESGATEVTETTESGATEMTETTESGATEITETTESGASEESTVSGSTEATETSESGMTSESSATESTVSGETSESSATESSVSTETTESGPTETSESGATEETGSTESTSDIWSTTESSYSTSEGSSWGTTPYTIEAITARARRKCVRRKEPACKSTPFGCCYDLITPAQGPFDKGCPTPKTCNETKFGCCPDNVSPATGPKNRGCPKADCKDTLFGCCPDNETPAEGNDNEGCQKEPKCLQSKYGCCADNSTKAQGPNRKGCKECGKFGCCPDGITKATGKNNKGCEEVTSAKTPEDCAKSKFGCCPNGESAAQGEHFKGCDIINKDNCTASYYGCCPDGTSPAHGPEYQGCRMACEDQQYGCCSDRITAAHGPNQEGCCLVHPYGCCPDNILPARGPNLEGCGCQYSPYGCCPDNVTAARGRNNEGCGCQHTEHGCCPDRYTPAAGPDNQGCACHTFQFGCCPDGVTIAKGPRKQGCDCRNTEFGCCSDDRTPAQGANFAGCDCASSKYGCCPDGVTDAQGENFEGCENVPPNKQEVCSLSKDRGTCNNYTVKWFFDMEYGGCSRFWYGGCDGNANRFMSMEECKNICIEPQGKDICQLPKVTGACEGYYPSWYYDKDRKQCAQFIWGGCLGNANRFETREDCQALCHVDRDQDACEQPREEGPCRGSYRRWYFNKESNTCEQFAYGGCKPNNNNFQTEMACKQQCLQPGRKKDLCALPRAQGNCTQKEPRWYFDAAENRCMPFYYSGCHGNNNRFISREACENDCPTDVERDTCILPALVGECHDYTERWYYNTNEKRCRQFYYGGCGGNDNNFATEAACLQRCDQPITTPAPQQIQFQREHCFLSSEVGPCRSQTIRWYYDHTDGVCKQFQYGGCQGNPNNFETKEECHHRCGAVQDVCDLPLVVGPCNSDHLQWFYDKQTDTCQMFNYGGCQGNDNRFNDQESCERRCKRTHEPVTYAPPDEQIHTERPYYPEQHLSVEGQICYSPADVGNCTGNEPAYYYNAASQNCEAFVYTGCGGNANRFISEEQCQRHCGTFRGLDVCSHPKDTGNCKTPIVKWYYDHETRRCQQFYYGGCGGSGNRFSFLEECESICVKLIEPPAPSTHNDTSDSHSVICSLPVEVGPCEGKHHHMRWYYDQDRHQCTSFIYSGCGGNQNNFRSHQQCVHYCHSEFEQNVPQNEIDVEQPPPKSRCEEYRDECTNIVCPYGTEGFVDVEECNRCRCYEPCRDTICPEGTLCAIDLNPNASMPQQTQFIATCRPTNKEGVCPHVSGIHECAQECRSDADCSGELKCCPTNCGTTCVVSYKQEPYVTDYPAFTDAPHISGGDSPVIVDQNSETELSAEEGSYVLLRCHAQGNPQPTITWRKGHEIIDGSQPRQRILSDGSLQLVGLDKGDKGIYSCSAENGIGHPARKDVKLDITDPTPHPANVTGDEDPKITVTLGAPYYLRCFAYGWPRPTVTWWRGDSMLPFSSEAYEQKRDYTLLIRSVKLQNLGVYTCQAYNGLGKAASWSLTIQSLGPVLSNDPEDEQYKRFLIAPQDRPTTPRPVWPFRPTRLQPRPTPPQRVEAPYWPAPVHVPVPTPQAHIPDPYTEPNPEIIPGVYTVPVRTNITLSRNVFPVDSDISIPCDVDGHPTPRVHWYKNRAPLEPSEKIYISESHRLTIVRATTEDSGEYLCEAENEFSKSSSSVNISVEGIYIHPNCTDNPFFANCGLIVQANYCTHKYYARFCCRSCTQAGQLPSYGPHLVTESRKSESERSHNNL